MNMNINELFTIVNNLSHYDKKALEEIFTFMSNVKGLQI